MSDAMIMRRGGGANLNFRITQYAPDTDLSNFIGKTNEIAVLTATPIADWSISMTEPLVPATGDVWIKTGTSSLNNIEALKKHSIKLNLQGAYQYETGAWVRKKAYLWQGGRWNDMDIFLFDNGDQCTDRTGGWTKSLGDAAEINITNAYIQTVGKGSGGGGAVYTTNKVPLTGYTALKAKLNITSHTSTGDALSLYISSATGNNPSKTAYSQVARSDTGDMTLTVDISAYRDGEYYVGFRNFCTNCKIYEVWLE